MRLAVRFAGAGGHGLVTAAILLADGSVRAGKNVCQTQSYGPEARGGGAHADVLISDTPILHPKVTNPDILVILTQDAFDAFAPTMSDGGIIFADSTIVLANQNCRAYSLPILQTAMSRFGAETYAGVISVGVAGSMVIGVGWDALKEAIVSRFPGGAKAKNVEAFGFGWAVAAKAVDAPAPPSFDADL